MSSEMRDAVKALEAEYRKRATNRAEDGWVTLVNCANDLRALLARTEAGADGAVAFRIALGDCIWQDRVFHAPSHDLAVERGTPIKYAYTHPQDASGDAVTEADIVALVAGPYKYHHKMDEQAEREAKAFDRCRELTIQKVQTFFAMRAAMQAKEAK